MFKKTIAIWNLVLCGLMIQAQYQAATWPMEYNGQVLKITRDTFEIYKLSPVWYGFIACGSISDSLGNLRLFSFGTDVRNKYGTVVEGGESVSYYVDYPNDTASIYGQDPHLQGLLFLPRPGMNNQYYLFVKDMDSTLNGQPTRVTATLIDASANNDSGKVMNLDKVILHNRMLSDSRMTACRHANGRDWWLINHQYLSDTIYTHLVTPDSIYGPFEQGIGLPGSEPDFSGWSLFSPDGNTFASVTEGMNGITVLDFDRCNGVFSNFHSIYTGTGNFDTTLAASLAFSPNGRFLYTSNLRIVYQYDLQASDIAESRVELVNDTTGIELGGMVLMPDGKIYQGGLSGFDSTLSVIDSPDIEGMGCGYHLRTILVPSSELIGAIPNFPNYDLGPLKGSACDTLITEVQPISEKWELNIYPNPAIDKIVISYGVTDNEYKPMELEICNLVGQTIYTHTLSIYSPLQKIDIGGFVAGMYIVYLKRQGAVVASSELVKE